MKKIRLGIMGLGEIGRHLYRSCLDDDKIEVVAISDIGKPEILHYLLQSLTQRKLDTRLEGNYLVSENGRARMMQGSEPGSVPWDVFGVDFVVDATGIYRSRADMQRHIDAGAKRVIMSTLPNDDADRIFIMSVTDNRILCSDKIISPGSSTTNAALIMLKTLDEAFGFERAMLSTIHAYTADQPLRNTVGHNFRRSRSAVENIIPNTTPSPEWIQKIMPEYRGRIEGTALNVPVSAGSVLDLTTVLNTKGLSKEDVNNVIEEKAKKYPNIIEVINDPIVSSDVLENRHSVIYDKMATMITKGRMLKTLTWYHNTFALALRIKEIMIKYTECDEKGGKK
jgi:glyceraldehyde 3-phosphate dehydrogenase